MDECYILCLYGGMLHFVFIWMNVTFCVYMDECYILCLYG